MSLAFAQIPELPALVPIQDKCKIAALIKAVVRTADNWSLTNAEAAALFDVPTATWSRMRAGTYKGTPRSGQGNPSQFNNWPV